MLVVLAAAGVLATAPTPIESAVQWTAPRECPSATDALQQLTHLCAKTMVSARASVRIEARDDEYVAEVILTSPAGRDRRVLREHRCGVLTDAVALVVAVGLEQADVPAEPDDTGATPPLVPDTPKPGTTREGKQKSTPSATDPPTPPSVARRPADDAIVEPTVQTTAQSDQEDTGGIGVAVQAGGGGDFGSIGTAAGGVGAGLGVLGRHWRAESQWAYWLPRRFRPVASHGADLTAWWGSLRGCGVPRWHMLEFPLCAGLEAGAVSGRPVDLAQAERQRHPWLAIAVDGGALWRLLPWLGLRLQLGGAWPILRSSFRIAPVGVIHETWPVVARMGVAVEVRFQ